MVKYKPVEFDIFPPKMLVENQVNSLYTFSKISEGIIDEARGFIGYANFCTFHNDPKNDMV